MILTTRWVFQVAAALLLTLTLVAPGEAQDKVGLIFSAGPTGGTWTPMAAATADVIKKKFPELDVQVEPGAALVNIEKIRNDKADIGWSMTTVLADARAGVNTWKGKQTDKPLFVANYYPNVWQLVVPADSDVRKLEDLKGKAVALPPRGNTSLAEGWELLLKVVRHEARRPRDQELRLDHRERGGRSGTGRRWRWAGTPPCPASFMLDLGTSLKLRMIGSDRGHHQEAAGAQPRIRPARDPEGHVRRHTGSTRTS